MRNTLLSTALILQANSMDIKTPMKQFEKRFYSHYFYFLARLGWGVEGGGL